MENISLKDFSFLIVAGGSGSRIGGLSKQFRSLGKAGAPLWQWSADLAFRSGLGEVVLVLPVGSREHASWPGLGQRPKIIHAEGGSTRTESVRNGLAACSRGYVMVHDAARPFAGGELLRRLAESVSPTAGAIPVMPVSEAVKHIDGEKGVVRAVDREGLYVTQTPQVFPLEALRRVLGEREKASFKDEAEAWLDAGLELRWVEGERLNFKVTWPEDLELAEALAEKRENRERSGLHTGQGAMPLARTGIGYDVHRMTPERLLILGGVVVPSPLGLLGHSDADVLAHAVADAILGAAGLPDIGNLFPASDDKYRGADSMELLGRAAALVKAERWEVVWVDAVLEAQVPRLNSFLPEMAKRLSAVLSPEPEVLCVNLKAKSPERTGDPGMARSMTCRAVATLSR